jgi:predicted dehydrogenase
VIRAAILGCGKIADAHLAQIKRIRGCAVVAACDRELLMAEQLCERFKVGQPYRDTAAMIDESHPDVVHITTPPESHYELGKLCLLRGCHFYVEKPFTINGDQADELTRLANRTGRKLTVGHDLQFSPVAMRMRRLITDNYLGGRPLHMESYYSYDLSDPGYAKVFLADKDHWVRRLPGKLLHNVISHGIARMAEFMDDDNPTVFAHGFVSPLLRNLGEREIIDELRVIISDAKGTTAYFTFSSQMRPSLNRFRLYGPQNGLILDEDNQTLIKCSGTRLKSYAERFIPPVTLAGQQIGNTITNLRKFLANDFHMKAGMKALIESFYRSIDADERLPISYREIVLTARIMDAIFEQVGLRGISLAADGEA